MPLAGRLQARLSAREPEMCLLRLEAGPGKVLLPRRGHRHHDRGWDRGHSELLVRSSGVTIEDLMLFRPRTPSVWQIKDYLARKNKESVI